MSIKVEHYTYTNGDKVATLSISENFVLTTINEECKECASEKEGHNKLRTLGYKKTNKMTEEVIELVEDTSLEGCKQKAQSISKKEGVVQHVNKREDGTHHIDDFYDSKKTVASYEDGKLKESLDESAIDAKGYKSSTGGLTQKGRDAYNAKGGHLQAPVTTPPSELKAGSKDSNRRKSFCARMSGVEGPMKDEKGEPTRKALALKKWNCNEDLNEAKSPTIGTRLVKKYGSDEHRAEVRYNPDYQEYQVHHYKDGKHMGEGPVSYHGDDKQDAHDTAKSEAAKRMVKESDEAYAKSIEAKEEKRKMDNITPSDKKTIGKISDLLSKHKKPVKEDTQLDELSKTTMKSYLEKGILKGMKDSREGKGDISKKRQDGLNKAIKKVYTEDATEEHVVHVNDGSKYGEQPHPKDAEHVMSGVKMHKGEFDGHSDKGAFFKFKSHADAKNFKKHVDSCPHKSCDADLQEDVQIDELKKSTLASYTQKAATSMSNASFGQGMSSGQYKAPEEKDTKTFSKRMKGIVTATSKMAKEDLDEATKPTVNTKKYSWGTMKTVHHGADFSIPLHPEHHEAIAKLKDEQEHHFKDETGRSWTARRKGNDVHFQGANGGNSTTVKHSTMTEATEHEWSKTGKTAKHIETGKTTYEYAEVDKNGNKTGKRVYKDKDGNLMGEAVIDPQDKRNPDIPTYLRKKQGQKPLSYAEIKARSTKNVDAYRKRAGVTEDTEELEENGLWDNIHAKQKRIKNGSGEKMRKPGSKGAPTDAAIKAASESAEIFPNLASIVENNSISSVVFNNGETTNVNPDHAGALINLHGMLSDENKQKLAEYAHHSAENFSKVVDWALTKIK